MSSFLRTIAGTAAVAGLVLVSASTATATTQPTPGTGTTQSSPRVKPHIAGGTTASSENIVQLIFRQYGEWYACTGTAISAQWVVTAKHCIEGDDQMYVYYSNSTTDRGPGYRADKLLMSSVNDVGLIRLATPKVLVNYGKLTNGYTPKAGDAATIWGYGHLKGGADSPGLRKANVTVLGSGKDLYKGPAIHIEGKDGSSNKGDSGGPLMVGNEIVGVCSKGDPNDGGPGIRARSFYGAITDSRSWIKQQTGV